MVCKCGKVLNGIMGYEPAVITYGNGNVIIYEKCPHDIIVIDAANNRLKSYKCSHCGFVGIEKSFRKERSLLKCPSCLSYAKPIKHE